MKYISENLLEILVICVTGVFITGAIYSLANKIILNQKSFSWTAVEGSIESLKFKQKSVDLRYSYQVAGDHYISSNISYLKAGTLDDKYYFKNLENLESSIPVYVDPLNFSNSVLVRRSFSIEYILVDLFFLSILVTAIVIFIRRYLLIQ